MGPSGIGKTGNLKYTFRPELTDATWGVAKVLWAVDEPVLVRGPPALFLGGSALIASAKS